MKPKYLYHGSRLLIKNKFLKPNRPSDKTQKENYLYGVYATDRKDIAIGMALTGDKYTKSFGDYQKKPFQAVFVRSQPKRKFVYVYKVSSKTFKEQPKGSHQWVSSEPVKILNIQKIKVENKLWRKATKKEKTWYYKMKKQLH